jgi:diguanylate cyclase (GGDEF)-like protein
MSLYLVATAIATLYANHSIEYAERQSYLLRLEQAQKAAALDRLNASLAVTSTTDWVTGIDNRRGFQTKLEEACRLAQRSQRPLALALIDIDHFKAYNDTHGHPAGDACLAAVARLLRTGIRAGTDTLARYGGEEFAVILPGADLALALLAGERLRQAVARAELPHGGGGNGPFVSISIGVASAGVGAGAGAGPAPVAARLLEAADQALYRAKKTGRDRVEAADCC